MLRPTFNVQGLLQLLLKCKVRMCHAQRSTSC
jgi:hypothetical protein